MKQAFFVTPIGRESSPERQRSDNVLEFVLKPVFGNEFEIIRADHVTSMGSINHDIIERLVESDLVIADLTGTNPNVMYEIGIRHAFNLPIIQIAQKDQNLPFDLGQERTIFIDINDIRDVERAKHILESALTSTTKKSYLGPVARAIKYAPLHRDDSSISEALVSIIDKIESLEFTLDNFQVELDPELSFSDQKKLDHIYEVLSPVRPYEAELMFEALRKIARNTR